MRTVGILQEMRSRTIQLAILIALTMGAYWNSFPGAFHYDDFPELLDEPSVTEQPFQYVWLIEHYGGRPLTLWTFHWSYRLFGDDPLGYHAFSFLLHLLCVAGVFLLAGRMLQQRPSSGLVGPAFSSALPFLAGLIFALHPLQTQAVNYIWSRSVLLMAAFSLACLLAARRHFGAALALAQLAVWSRTEAVLLFPILILLDRRRWKAPALLAVLNLGAFAYSLHLYAPAQVAWNYSGWMEFYWAQPAILVKYLGMMIWPSGLHIDHQVESRSLLQTLAALALLTGLGGACLHLRRRFPAVAWGVGWTALWLSPGLLIPNSDWINESRTYLAMAGFALASAGVLAALQTALRLSPLPSAALATALMLLAMAPLTLERNRLWQDDVALYRDAAAKSPGKSRVHYNLGSALARAGRPAEAEKEFRLALALQPDDDLSQSAIGYCAEVQQRRREARRHYQKALQLNPDNRRAREGLERLAVEAEDGL